MPDEHIVDATSSTTVATPMSPKANQSSSAKLEGSAIPPSNTQRNVVLSTVIVNSSKELLIGQDCNPSGGKSKFGSTVSEVIIFSLLTQRPHREEEIRESSR